MRHALAITGLVLVVVAVWLMRPPRPFRVPDRLRTTSPAPSAADEGGEPGVLADDGEVRTAAAPKAPRIHRRATMRPSPPSLDRHPAPAVVRESSSVPAARPSTAPHRASVVLEPGASIAEENVARPPVVTPPALVTAPAAYPAAGYQVVIDRSALTPAVRLVAAEGRVRLRILVLPDGSVGEVHVTSSSGSAVLDDAAVRAAMGWHFEPGLRDGTPIEAWVVVPVQFVVP